MDQLPAFGTAIQDCAPKTFALYADILSKNAANITTTPRETSSYGPHPRQELDVYYPSASKDASKNGSAPILIFFYGGGLVRGAKVMPDVGGGLIHRNVGHFCAEKLGCVTVIPDYRLLQHGAQFPSGGEDVALAVEWVTQNLAPAHGQRDLFIMGNSAGGIHMSTFLYAPQFADARAKVIQQDGQAGVPVRLRGAVQLSVPFHFRQAAPHRADVLGPYFGDVEKNSPLGLFEAFAREQGSASLGYRTVAFNGTLDPEEEILVPLRDFEEAWEKSGVQPALIVEVMQSHNHISPPLSLGTARKEEEAWGYQLGQWMEGARK